MIYENKKLVIKSNVTNVSTTLYTSEVQLLRPRTSLPFSEANDTTEGTTVDYDIMNTD